MGIIRKTLATATIGTAAFVGYLHTSTSITCPLPSNDPLWTSKSYRKYNVHLNASTQDVVTKRIPIDKIKPELLESEGALVTEFCRGVWSGWGYSPQRLYLHRKYHAPQTASQLWTRRDLASAEYSPGTQITDHFEVVEKTPTAITVRCGDSPLNFSPRESDGLFVISAEVDREAGEVELGLKSCFFSSERRIEGIRGPMLGWVEVVHAYYARLWMVSGCRRVLR